MSTPFSTGSTCDDQTRIEGAETEFYQALTPPYSAKNGPIDDITELLLIKGITPEIYYGISVTNSQPTYFSQQRGRFGQLPPPYQCRRRSVRSLHAAFRGKVNINTASAEVLQLIPG